MMTVTTVETVERAAEAIAEADALLIAAGAGMGVDSGLPDYRGEQGFWRSYPPYARLGLKYAAVANPDWLETDAAFAWGFYGHVLGLYRRTVPHPGFEILRCWARGKEHGAFVATSNIDGQFQRAGYDPARILEFHGAIARMQCTRTCGIGVFSADADEVSVDETTMRAREPLPSCPSCGALARPNILMFGDLDWDPFHFAAQHDRLLAWLRAASGSKLVVIECGAGKVIASIRRFCEQTADQTQGILIRINPRDPEVPGGHLSLATGALEGLRAIDARFQSGS